VQTTAEQLLEQARTFARDSEVVALGGLSMGALLALIATSERTSSRALLLLAPALRLHGRNRYFMAAGRLPGVDRLPFLIPKGPPETGAPVRAATSSTSAVARIAEEAEQRPGHDGRYDRIPLRWAAELRRLQRLAAEAAPRVTCPTLVMHGLRDRTADPAGAVRLTQLLGGRVHARFFEASPHVLTLGPDRGAVADETVRWLQAIVPVPEDLRLAGL
jgi:pimeloyl-ACP methyl ester carboxylesterase